MARAVRREAQRAITALFGNDESDSDDWMDPSNSESVVSDPEDIEQSHDLAIGRRTQPRTYVMQRLQNLRGRRAADVALKKRFLGIEDPQHLRTGQEPRAANKAMKRCKVCNSDACGVHSSKFVICVQCVIV